MASFQAKISWERLRKREKKKKKIVPTSSYLTRYRKLKKNSKNIQTHYCGFFPSQNMLGKAEKERKKHKKKNHSDEFLPDS